MMKRQISLLILLGCVFGDHRLDIPEDYQPHMRPLAKNEEMPLEVVAALNLRNIVDISETSQQITLERDLPQALLDRQKYQDKEECHKVRWS